MKKILGLDLGSASIGWAFVKEAETESEKSEIVKMGVRVVPITTEEETNFLKGKALTINAERTLKRSMRRNLNRYKLRRKALIEILEKNELINKDSILSEEGKNTTHKSYELRARATREKVSKEELAKILLMINKKRGYKSNRKIKEDEEGQLIDGMDVAKKLYNENLTPGQYVNELLQHGKKFIPDFYRSDLKAELKRIWETQAKYYPGILTKELREQLEGKNKGATWKILEKPLNLTGLKQKGKPLENQKEKFGWRCEALFNKIGLEEFAIVIQEINNEINNTSGYLGAISDRSKELYFSSQTVGEYLYNQLQTDPNTSLKNQVFYRQDYLDEFETIWEKQSDYYPELTEELKKEIRDCIIFYQRRLKSQKGLLSYCEFESWEEEYLDPLSGKKKRRTIGHKVIPKSSPLFQEFKIWQILNNIELYKKETGEIVSLDHEKRRELFNELNIREKLSASEAIKAIGQSAAEFGMNYKELEGNRTNAELYKVYEQILNFKGKEHNFKKMSAEEINIEVASLFVDLGVDIKLMTVDPLLKAEEFDKQPLIQLWHLIYSYEGDNSKTGNEKLIEKIEKKFGFPKKYAKLIAQIKLQDDYGSLSSKAIRKILPSLIEGNKYDVACLDAGYNHSKSFTKKERENKILKERMVLIPKNSLRNPTVEKILNQMVNIVNSIIDDPALGKPDEIRVELARELKKSAKERKEASSGIEKATIENNRIRKLLQSDFGIKKVTRNDIIRYKLWEELKSYGYKTLYTNTYVAREEIFSNKFDIDHIIPQSRLFDDSFSNKVLAVKQVNIEKGNLTARDYLEGKLSNEEFNQYLGKIDNMLKKGELSKTKAKKLKMKGEDIPDGFIDRDLRNSQYIAKKAVYMLSEIVSTVNTTTGSVTKRLREDWELINIIKELTLPKYEMLGLVNTVEGKNGQLEKQIKNWTKRNDYRHHAIDALTVAFTTHSHVQYLNHMNARGNEKHGKFHKVYGIEKKYLYRDEKNKLTFIPPFPLDELRKEAKIHVQNILVSHKAKNKIVTRNKNRVKTGTKNSFKEKVELTPRGQLHNETIYGRKKYLKVKMEKVSATFDLDKVKKVANQSYRKALLRRLAEFGNNPKEAFTGKNSPGKNPIIIDQTKGIVLPVKVKVIYPHFRYSIRKEISPDLKIEKVYDEGVKRVLKKRLEEYGGDSKKAFANLDENPIWLNKAKGISVKRVSITGVANAISLHHKKDHNGNFILDENGKKIPVDYVNTSNNHHVAIYKDDTGKYHEEVVSFYEAVQRRKNGHPVINKQNGDLEFLFSMKQNELFVFPGNSFNPREVDLFDPGNAGIISEHLFRVQKISAKNYLFNHHCNTQAITGDILKNNKELSGHTFHFIQTPAKLAGIVKVRLNHLGAIVQVGE